MKHRTISYKYTNFYRSHHITLKYIKSPTCIHISHVSLLFWRVARSEEKTPLHRLSRNFVSVLCARSCNSRSRVPSDLVDSWAVLVGRTTKLLVVFVVYLGIPTKVTYTPENKHGTWKYPFGKGETFTNHQFLGSMFVLGGVLVWGIWWNLMKLYEIISYDLVFGRYILITLRTYLMNWCTSTANVNMCHIWSAWSILKPKSPKTSSISLATIFSFPLSATRLQEPLKFRLFLKPTNKHERSQTNYKLCSLCAKRQSNAPRV